MTAEVLFKTAWADLRQNQGLVAAYLLAHVLLACIFRAVQFVVLPEDDPVPAPLWLPAFKFTQQLVIVTMAALIQTIVLARLGKAIDIPLWKCRDDREALRRYFLLWALVNLGYVTLDQFASNAYQAGSIDMAYSLLMLIFMYTVIVFPLAVCLMYAGRFSSLEVSEIFAPLTRNLALTGTVFLLLAMSFMIHVALAPIAVQQESLIREMIGASLLTLPLALIELFVFAAVWRLCMYHRDTAYQDEGDPFD